MKYLLPTILFIQACACFITSIYLGYQSIIGPSMFGIKTLTSVENIEFKGYIALLAFIAGLGILAYLKHYLKYNKHNTINQ